MSKPHALSEHVGKLRTRMGACLVGQRALFRGHDLHAELKDMSWLALYVFGITGRRFSPLELRLLEAIWVYTSYPDARIWNNRVAALAGTARSSGNLGAAAALAVSEAAIYGRGIDIRAIDFFLRTRRMLAAGDSLEQCVRTELQQHRSIAGYGRPIAAGDERIEPMLQLARSLGLASGPHVRLAHEIDEFLHQGRWRFRMNYGALVAALAADLGLTAREYYLFMFPAFLAGMQPCYVEALERPAGALFPTPCSAVRYEGPAPRAWTGTA
ncbi:MAG TPA: hypothetical protein VFR86_00195, partial [Burkholderiaceae bacterium]|nr:hypothetical protein [Burkholderiaceae bacterium]